MKHYCLLAILAALFAAAPTAWGIDIFRPGDPVVAFDLTKVITTGSSSPGSGAEEVANILDSNPGTKYLNFGITRTGFIVTPAVNAALQSFVLTTANDTPARDPINYEIYGTNAPIASLAHGRGDGEAWTPIGTGSLALPETRLAIGPAVNISNGTAYSSYKVIFPEVKDLPAAANSMQIADVAFHSGPDLTGTSMLSPTDFIIPIRDVEATVSPSQSSSPPSGAENAPNAIDRNTATKYLNFGKENSGLIVTPSVGPTIATSFRYTTANDQPGRDPTSYRIYGTNEDITTPEHGYGDENNWQPIAEGTIAPPDARFTETETITFANTTAYKSYRIDFPTLRDPNNNSMQIAEVQLATVNPATLVVNRQTGEVRIRADQNVTFSAYELESLILGLNPSGWNSITSTNADPNDTWTITSATAQLMAEQDLPTGANDGISLSAGSSLSLGNVWQALPVTYENGLNFSLFGLTGNLIADGVEFEGTEIPLGDYSGNGTVGPEDWPFFRAGMGGNYQGLSISEAYLGGDLDGDFDSDIYDFNLFVASAGGFAALFGTSQIPEPSSVMLVAAAIVGGIGYRFRTRRFFRRGAMLGVALTTLLAALPASAQTFSVVGGKPIGITTPDALENAQSGPEQLFDDIFFEQNPSNINQSLFAENYTELQGVYAQFAGQGPAPKSVFFDYGSPVTANWFAYAQRAGGNPLADRVGKFELWFSNSSFNDTIPATPADAVVELLPDDDRLFDSTIRPYTLGGDKTGRYVAMRLTLTEVSAAQPTNNVGGHEFRLMQGPSTLILDVDRGTGAMTIRNNGTNATNFELQSYSIESPSGGLNAAGFNGIRGDTAAFPAGNGSGNGWEIGGGSNSDQLIEAYFSGTSTIAAGTTGLSLGNGYNPLTLADDLVFRWTKTRVHNGEMLIDMFDGIVNYVGIAPDITLGDYNDDGIVDAADYVVWRNNFGTTNVIANDSTPGSVDIDDYNRWKANYGNVGSGALTASVNVVPEPHSVVLSLLFTVVGATAIRRRLG